MDSDETCDNDWFKIVAVDTIIVVRSRDYLIIKMEMLNFAYLGSPLQFFKTFVRFNYN